MAYLQASPGATLSEPMTSPGFTNFGHFKPWGDAPDAGVVMSGGGLINQTSFLGATP